ncbi:MAG: hypothetical protein AAF821_26505 [Cyanobacteria bacterium P01_D01_bin.156]
MTLLHISFKLSLSLVLLLATVGITATVPANAETLKSTQKSTQSLVDFNEEDGLDEEAIGFHSIYVDREGNVLGTFVNVPGAKIKVYADGQTELESRDYTTEIDYYSDGGIRSIGNARFRYSRNGRIQTIGGTDFRYNRRGLFQRVGDIEIDYSSRGRLQKIEDVSFDYDRSGMIESIESRETRNGIRIVVVN